VLFAFSNKLSQLFNSSAHVSNRNQQTLFDDKKLTIGRGDKGDENLSGFEVSPTLMYRKDRLKTETDNLTIITSRLKETFVDGVCCFVPKYKIV
jgi:uncharacterized protein (DUF2461 family)